MPVVFALTVAIGQVHSASSGSCRIPFEYNRAFGLMLIKVEVNGKPAVMVLDAGSNETIVSPRLVIVKRSARSTQCRWPKGLANGRRCPRSRCLKGRIVEFKTVKSWLWI
jgi:hypothetical protein